MLNEHRALLRSVPTGIRPVRGRKVETGIWGLLVWSFAVEKVSLDFDELASVAGERPGIGTEYLLMKRHDLGCAIDGGGRSEPHPDADLVASAVANLAEGWGGRRMAIWIAELARADRWPDPMVNARPRCEPVDWKAHKGKLWARKELWQGDGRVSRWPVSALGRDDGYACPVTYRDTAQHVGAARRSWLEWWGALLELRATFQIRSDLTAFKVTDAMPPQRPWQQKC